MHKETPPQSSMEDTLEDLLCQNAYKVKDLVCDAIRQGNWLKASIELNIFFAKSFNPAFYLFQPDQEELVKQLNKLLAKTELYSWDPFKKNIFPAIGVLFHADFSKGERLPGAYRTLYLVYKNKHLFPKECWEYFLLSDLICDFYTFNLREALHEEFGSVAEVVFDEAGQVKDKKQFKQIVEFTKKRISAEYGNFKDQIEEKEFPVVLATIALQGMKAFTTGK